MLTGPVTGFDPSRARCDFAPVFALAEPYLYD